MLALGLGGEPFGPDGSQLGALLDHMCLSWGPCGPDGSQLGALLDRMDFSCGPVWTNLDQMDHSGGASGTRWVPAGGLFGPDGFQLGDLVDQLGPSGGALWTMCVTAGLPFWAS